MGETSFGSIHGRVGEIGGVGVDREMGAGIGNSIASHRAKGIPL